MIPQKLRSLATDRGVKLEKIGEVLGTDKDTSKQNKFAKLNSFRRRSAKTYEELKKISEFFNVPVSYFVTPENEQ